MLKFLFNLDNKFVKMRLKGIGFAVQLIVIDETISVIESIVGISGSGQTESDFLGAQRFGP